MSSPGSQLSSKTWPLGLTLLSSSTTAPSKQTSSKLKSFSNKRWPLPGTVTLNHYINILWCWWRFTEPMRSFLLLICRYPHLSPVNKESFDVGADIFAKFSAFIKNSPNNACKLDLIDMQHWYNIAMLQSIELHLCLHIGSSQVSIVKMSFFSLHSL